MPSPQKFGLILIIPVFVSLINDMENFQAINPSILLAPYVKQYWFLSTDNTNLGSQRAIPSGSIAIVFNRGGEIYLTKENRRLPRSYIFGQSTLYTDTCFRTLDLVIIIFQPIGIKAFFNIPMNELNGLSLDIDALCDAHILELKDHLLETTDNRICAYWIEQFLLKRICRFETYNYKRLVPVIAAINNGENDIASLAQRACLGHKQFNRIFMEYVGLNPKEYLKINRFSKTLHTLQIQPQIGLNELAYQCGYYDKSHLIKEMKTYSGYTPSQFLKNSDPYSEYMSLFQSFFIDTKPK